MTVVYSVTEGAAGERYGYARTLADARRMARRADHMTAVELAPLPIAERDRSRIIRHHVAKLPERELVLALLTREGWQASQEEVER